MLGIAFDRCDRHRGECAGPHAHCREERIENVHGSTLREDAAAVIEDLRLRGSNIPAPFSGAVQSQR
jgi:hypothetical protein